MHIGQKTELFKQMIWLHDGEVLGDTFISYIELLRRVFSYNDFYDVEFFQSRCESLLDLEEI